MPFKPATKEVGYVKGSIYGPPGSGKTTLLAMLLIYLSKTYHKCAPVAWLASEKGVDFVMDFFSAEGVPLLVQRSRAFVDLKESHAEAVSNGCCGLGIDSTTHFWQELLSTGMKGRGTRMSKLQRVKEEWSPFAADFQDLPIHSLATGRLGFKWEDYEIENEKGEIEKEIMRAGTKMKAEGDFGHEPDLEIEMAAVEDPDFIKYEKVRGRARRTFRSQMLHVATIKKSRVWALNGKAFSWKDQPGYKLGYYKTVAEMFQPHFDTIAIGGTHHVGGGSGNSRVLFEAGSDQSVAEQQANRAIALETWQTTMELIAGGQTKENIRKRAIIGEALTGTRSRTEFERQPLEQILHAVETLRALERRLHLDAPTNDQEWRRCCSMAEEDVTHPGKNGTLLEMMLQASLDGRRGPQPVVALIDSQREPF
jgi:hypothetical protein